MKKFGKFLTGTAVLAGIAAGAYYVYKNYIASDEDLDDLDDLDDFDDDETTEVDESERDYVSINIAKDSEADDDLADLPEEAEEVDSVSDPE